MRTTVNDYWVKPRPNKFISVFSVWKRKFILTSIKHGKQSLDSFPVQASWLQTSGWQVTQYNANRTTQRSNPLQYIRTDGNTWHVFRAPVSSSTCVTTNFLVSFSKRHWHSWLRLCVVKISCTDTECVTGPEVKSEITLTYSAGRGFFTLLELMITYDSHYTEHRLRKTKEENSSYDSI